MDSLPCAVVDFAVLSASMEQVYQFFLMACWCISLQYCIFLAAGSVLLLSVASLFCVGWRNVCCSFLSSLAHGK